MNDMYRVLKEDIRERIEGAVPLGKTGEGKFIIGVVCQFASDAIGLYDSDKEKLYVKHEGNARGKRKYITRQQDAVEWFRAKGHYPWCDMIDVEPSWVNWLLKTKCGVEI